MKKYFLLIIICLPLAAFAQLPIPTFDVALKTGYTGDITNYDGFNYRLELNVHINQFLAIGGFYTKSVWGQNFNGDVVDEEFDVEQLLIGARIQVSTGRVSKFRPYGFLTLTKFETVEEVSPLLNFADDWTGITFGAGLMIRLSNKLYLNVIEFEYIPAGGEFFFIDRDDDFISVRIGANYTFGKKR